MSMPTPSLIIILDNCMLEEKTAKRKNLSASLLLFASISVKKTGTVAAPIIHCDLKPSNVLLDDDMVAHVGDFGLAKFLHQPPHSSSLGVRGTVGYTAPEYGLANEVSANGDIYSFGIILLEMMTRKKPTNVNFGEGDGLHNLCKMAFPDQVLEIVDPILLQGDEARENDKQGSIQTRIDNNSECLISMMKIGIACSMEAPEDRMGISDALKNLHLIRKNCTQTTMVN